MDFKRWLKRTFYLICGLVAAGMSTYWFNEYSLDKDTSAINYKQAKEVQIESRPVLSLCFNLINTIKIDGYRFEGNLYLDFMKGRFSDPVSYRSWLNFVVKNLRNQYSAWDNDLRNAPFNRTKWTSINYSSVTPHLADFIQEYELTWINGSVTNHNHFMFHLLRYPRVSYSGIILHDADFIKCFQIQLGHDEITNVKLTVQREIFPPPNGHNGYMLQVQIRPQTRGLFVLMHRPNQILLSRNTLIHKWPKFDYNSLSFDTWFTIENIEVVKRRHKKTKPCSKDENDYDKRAVEEHVQSIGCRTPFQEVDVDVPICTSVEDMRKAHFPISLENFDNQPYPRPCNSIDNIKFSYEDHELRNNKAGVVRFWPLKPSNYFKEIEQARAIPFLDLVGNVGGFIGIFIGHSVLQLLQSMLGCMDKMEQKFFKPYWKRNLM